MEIQNQTGKRWKCATISTLLYTNDQLAAGRIIDLRQGVAGTVEDSIMRNIDPERRRRKSVVKASIQVGFGEKGIPEEEEKDTFV